MKNNENLTLDDFEKEYAGYDVLTDPVLSRVVGEYVCQNTNHPETRLIFKGFQKGDSRISVAYCPFCNRAFGF